MENQIVVGSNEPFKKSPSGGTVDTQHLKCCAQTGVPVQIWPWGPLA